LATAEIIVTLVTAYGAVGLIVAAAFLLFGIDRIDDSARGVYAFRPLLIPGIVLLWPFVLWRWYVLERQRSAQDGKAEVP
jgi:hypothetical protein